MTNSEISEELTRILLKIKNEINQGLFSQPDEKKFINGISVDLFNLVDGLKNSKDNINQYKPIEKKKITNWKVVKCKPRLVPKNDRNPNRFAIVDDHGKVLDDAGGWGYKTEESAKKSAWYKFSGGKEKIEMNSRWWDDHPEFKKEVNNFYDTWCMEISTGDMDQAEIELRILEIALEHDIHDFEPKYLEYL